MRLARGSPGHHGPRPAEAPQAPDHPSLQGAKVAVRATCQTRSRARLLLGHHGPRSAEAPRAADQLPLQGAKVAGTRGVPGTPWSGSSASSRCWTARAAEEGAELIPTGLWIPDLMVPRVGADVTTLLAKFLVSAQEPCLDDSWALRDGRLSLHPDALAGAR